MQSKWAIRRGVTYQWEKVALPQPSLVAQIDNAWMLYHEVNYSKPFEACSLKVMAESFDSILFIAGSLLSSGAVFMLSWFSTVEFICGPPWIVSWHLSRFFFRKISMQSDQQWWEIWDGCNLICFFLLWRPRHKFPEVWVLICSAFVLISN